MSDLKEFIIKRKINSELVKLEETHFKGDVLFHGINIQNAQKALLETGVLEPRTTQRYWKDGRALQDNHKDYRESGWMYGWSTSRDKFLAGTFGNVLFVFDKAELRKEFKIQPISWSYRVSGGPQYTKREREDFVISHKNPLPLDADKAIDVYHEYCDSLPDNKPSAYEDFFEFHRLHNMKPKNMDLNKVLKGFFVSKDTIEIYKSMDFKPLLNHPLFKGIYDREENKNKVKQSTSEVYRPKRNKL